MHAYVWLNGQCLALRTIRCTGGLGEASSTTGMYIFRQYGMRATDHPKQRRGDVSSVNRRGAWTWAHRQRCACIQHEMNKQVQINGRGEINGRRKSMGEARSMTNARQNYKDGRCATQEAQRQRAMAALHISTELKAHRPSARPRP